MLFHPIENKISVSQKFRKKCSDIYLLGDFHQKLIDINVTIILNIKFHEILSNSSRATLAKKFLSHTYTYIQTFPRNS